MTEKTIAQIVSEAVEWTYERPEGDLCIYAANPTEALAELRNHGFLIVYPEKLKRTGRTLREYMALAEKAVAETIDVPESKRPIDG